MKQKKEIKLKRAGTLKPSNNSGVNCCQKRFIDPNAVYTQSSAFSLFSSNHRADEQEREYNAYCYFSRHMQNELNRNAANANVDTNIHSETLINNGIRAGASKSIDDIAWQIEQQWSHVLTPGERKQWEIMAMHAQQPYHYPQSFPNSLIGCETGSLLDSYSQFSGSSKKMKIMKESTHENDHGTTDKAKQHESKGLMNTSVCLQTDIPTKRREKISSTAKNEKELDAKEPPQDSDNKNKAVQQTDEKGSSNEVSKPKRPMTAYLFFAQEMRPIIKHQNPQYPGMTVTKELGKLWSCLTKDEKEKYKRLEANARQEYLRDAKKWRMETNGGSTCSSTISNVASHKSPDLTVHSPPTTVSTTCSSTTASLAESFDIHASLSNQKLSPLSLLTECALNHESLSTRSDIFPLPPRSRTSIKSDYFSGGVIPTSSTQSLHSYSGATQSNTDHAMMNRTIIMGDYADGLPHDFSNRVDRAILGRIDNEIPPSYYWNNYHFPNGTK